MMGAGHALLGTATWAVTATVALPAAGMTVTPTILIAGAIPVAGAALIPDIDHPTATMANAGGPITKIISKTAATLSGGHREGTHTLWFFLATTTLAFATTTLTGIWGAIAWFFTMSAFGAQALAKTELHRRFNKVWKKNTGIFAKAYCWAFAAAATAFAIWVFGLEDTGKWWWLPWAIALGHLSHLIGDSITTAGLKLGWGLPKVRLPLLGDAGSSRETIFMWALVAITAFFMGCAIIGINPLAALTDIWKHLSTLTPDTSGGFILK